MKIKKSCAVVVSVYKSQPSEYEIVSIRQIIKHLSDHKIFLACPNDLDISCYTEIYEALRIIRFAKEYFLSINAYNKLMLSVEFYQKFIDYDFLLVCQPDVLIISNRIEEFINLGYDYIGAPAPVLVNGSPIPIVENGGLSLRNIQNTIKLLSDNKSTAESWERNEDEFFSMCGLNEDYSFSMAPMETACRFSFDRFPRLLWHFSGNRIPFGIHGWYVHDHSFMNGMLAAAKVDVVLPSEDYSLINLIDFCNSHKNIFLYGAGVWGKTVASYLDAVGLNFECFIVSDGQNALERKCAGHAVKMLSTIEVGENDGIVITISLKYNQSISKEELDNLLAKAGIKNRFYIDENIYSQIVEELIYLKKIYANNNIWNGNNLQ